MNTCLQEQLYNPTHSFSQSQLHQRNNIFIISEQGQGFRQQLIDDMRMEKLLKKHDSQKMDGFTSNLPMLLSESDSQVSLSKLNSKAQMSLMGSKSKSKFLSEVKKDIPKELSTIPYINAQVDKITDQIMSGRTMKDKSATALNDRMCSLNLQLSIVNKLIDKRSLSIQLRPQYNAMSTVIEEEELQDKISAIVNLESRIERIGARYKMGKLVQNQVQSQVNMNIKRSKDAALKQLSEVPPLSLFDPKYQYLYAADQDQNNARFRLKVAEYQKKKFEWNWSFQTPPQFTSKQKQIETERKLQLQKQNEITEYEQSLKKLNNDDSLTKRQNKLVS